MQTNKDPPSERELDPGLREARARAENESRSAWFLGHHHVAFLCECPSARCGELLSLDRKQYAAIRASPIRFGVAPGHYDARIDRVVERHADHWVVEKSGKAEETVRRVAGPGT